MAQVWRPVMDLITKDLGNNAFVFQFFHQIDHDRVVQGDPWNFLTKVDIWVQLHDLVSGFKSERVAKNIGNFLSEILCADPKNYDHIWRDYMCVRVRMDVRKPLKRKMRIKMPKGDWVTISFKYERLGTFCFFCGMMGHSDRYCRKLFQTPGVTRDQFLFGPWLRADSRTATQAGARWSRLEVIAQGGGNTDKARAFNSPTFRGFKQNQMPNFGGQPMDKMVGDKGNGKKGESIHGKETSMEGSVLEDKDDDLIVTDPKCRRQDPEDSVAVNESLDMDNSKNGCGAGSGSQARQSL
ncbi:hypothetical protein P3X46_013802 [Hevea brasiliensis]|uniref:Zinc knuckle CX2CX4HX4C domain-containing protein n=1 Tax=Hevea brasiliensis TaxID=3981 RepID=A0ABQ9M8B7_HEVBR|nr:hypothetical protein P3X46_013802 [Hevea brasiliensis]